MHWARALRSDGVEATRALGALVAETAEPSAVVALCGELGTGKTRIVEGSARAMGHSGPVRSPTFTLMNVYRGQRPLYHFDLYRVERLSDEEADAWAEFWEQGGLSLIEWGDRIAAMLPPAALWIHLAHGGGSRRWIVVAARRGTWEALRARLEEVRWDAYPRAGDVGTRG
jgi:tRNA threonylcarbamoyladenosine biosynthesis protein TsaE